MTKRRQRHPPLPFHTSEQRLSPEMHQQLEAELNAETRRRNTVEQEPNPRYQLIHDPGEFPSDLPCFTVTFHLPSPSAAIHFGHRFADKLGISLCFYDRATNQVTAFGPLSAADD